MSHARTLSDSLQVEHEVVRYPTGILQVGARLHSRSGWRGLADGSLRRRAQRISRVIRAARRDQSAISTLPGLSPARASAIASLNLSSP
jgi:hypothetical protein